MTGLCGGEFGTVRAVCASKRNVPSCRTCTNPSEILPARLARGAVCHRPSKAPRQSDEQVAAADCSYSYRTKCGVTDVVRPLAQRLAPTQPYREALAGESCARRERCPIQDSARCERSFPPGVGPTDKHPRCLRAA